MQLHLHELQIPKELFSHIHTINIYKIKNPIIMSIFNKTEILRIISEKDKSQAYQDYVKYFDLALASASASYNSGIRQERRIQCSKEQSEEYSLHLTTDCLADNFDEETFHALYKCIGRSLIFGHKKISQLMLWEFDRPLLGTANIEELEDEADINVRSKKHQPLLLP